MYGAKCLERVGLRQSAVDPLCSAARKDLIV